jgi:hypothetical protein
MAIVSGVSERDGSSIYNSQVLVDAKGDIVAKYRKTHLYAVAPVEEQTCFAPAIRSRALRSAICALVSASVTISGFPKCTETRHRAERRRFLISSAWPFPATNIFVCSRKRARSRIKAT